MNVKITYSCVCVFTQQVVLVLLITANTINRRHCLSPYMNSALFFLFFFKYRKVSRLR